MIIVVDLDGVVYEWQRTYRYMMREYRGVRMPPVEEFWTEWDAPDQFTTQEDRDWIWSTGVEKGLFRYGHVVKGAIIGLNKLIDAGHSLRVATARPKQAVTDTYDWLTFLRIPFDEIRILHQGESKATVWGDILIDDRPENVKEWAEEGRTGIIFDQPWNQKFNYSRVYRAKGWGETVDTVRMIGGRHGEFLPNERLREAGII